MLIEKVRKTVKEHTLIGWGNEIVLGLSGGPDSVCLFHVLTRLSEEMDLKVHPVHVNHMFRPGAAERDQEYVEKLCADHGLECRSFKVDCNALAEKENLTPEEAGRRARYEAFYKVASEVASKNVEKKRSSKGKEEMPQVSIAVAQNANDQAETILHRMIRGTGPDGLAGIAYKRYEKDIPVIRPLLDITRDEIEEYCEKHGLDPVTDHTNNEPVYLRNRIRLELLPLLEDYNSNIVRTLARLARISASDRAYLKKKTDEAFAEAMIGEDRSEKGASEGRIVMDRVKLAGMEDTIRHRVVRSAFEKIGLVQDITEERLLAADAIILKKQGPKTVEFPHGFCLMVKAGEVIFRR